MQNLLKEYNYIILDFSVMFAELDSNLVKALNEAENVLVAPTFDCECKQMQKVVPYRIATRYKENKSNVTIDAKKVCKNYGTTDTFGLANYLSQDSASVLVIEANYSLEDRIVLSGLEVDVYCLFENTLIRHENYIAEGALRTIDKSKTPLTYCEVKMGDSVYTDNGTYVLADALEKGAEAQIYRVIANPKKLTKIYKEDEDGNFVLTSQKLKNINILREVNDNWDVLWLALPTAVIYADSSHKKPVGYMMNYFDETNFLSNNSLFNGGDIIAKFPEHDVVAVKDVLDICIKLVRQIMFLALNDIHISDYNDKNFAIPVKSDSKILMVDTDSYCCEGYVSECMTYSGCLSKKYEINTRLDLINLCDESLFAFIFTRLVLDSGFVPMRKSEFRFSAKKMSKLDNPNIKAKWQSIPTNLQNLFINIFDKKHPPSINVLLYELEVAHRQDFAKTKYKDIYKEVLETALAAQRPVTPSVVPQPQPVKPPPTKPKPPVLPTQPTPPPSKENNAWLYILIGAVIIGLAIWWFGFGHSGFPKQYRYEQPSSTPMIENAVPQLQRYETDNGYYLSNSPELDGYIEYYWDNGDSYKGNFSDGVRTGQGDYSWVNGDAYSGDFVDGQLMGTGTFYYSNGTKYVGGWKDGFFYGEGTYFFPNDGSYEDSWEYGTCNGGEVVNLTFTINDEPAAKGYWDSNIFYGSYYKNNQWYELP